MMNRLACCLVFCALLLTGCGNGGPYEPEPLPDFRAVKGWKGKPSRVTEVRDTYAFAADGTRERIEVAVKYWYMNSAGQLLQEDYQINDVSVYERLITIDTAGRMLREQRINYGPQYSTKKEVHTIPVYGSNGKLQEKQIFRADDERLLERETRSWDAQNRLCDAMTVFYEREEGQERNTTIYQTEVSYPVEGLRIEKEWVDYDLSTVTRYRNGRIRSRVDYPSDSYSGDSSVYRYGPADGESQIVTYDLDRNLQQAVVKSEGTHGLISEKRFDSDSLLYQWEIRDYGPHGWLERERLWNVAADLSRPVLDTSAVEPMVRWHEYQFDFIGNWTERITCNELGQIIEHVMRSFTYSD